MKKRGRKSTNTAKLYIRLSAEKVDQIKRDADNLGMAYTMFGGLMLWQGYLAWKKTNKQLQLDID